MGLAPRNTGLITQAAAAVAVLHHDPQMRKEAQNVLRALMYADWPACISAKPLLAAYRNVLQRTPHPVYRAPSN